MTRILLLRDGQKTTLDGFVIAPDSIVESDREVDSCPAPQSRDLSAFAQDNLVSCSLEP